MKKILPFIFALMAVSAIFCACDETKTYAEKMEEEDNAIEEFIRDSSITVLSQSEFYANDSVTDVSKNEIARMDAQKVYRLLTEWAKEFDPDFGEKLESDPEYATAILAIGRGGKKPRKDLATWKEAKPYMGFFYDEYLEKPVFDEKFSA